MSYREYIEELECPCGNTIKTLMSNDNGMIGPVIEPVICPDCEEEVEV